MRRTRISLLLVLGMLIALLPVGAAAPALALVAPHVSELHYDNTGGDVGEFVEVTGGAGIDLAGWRVELYNGSSTQLKLYDTINLAGVIDDEGTGIGALSFARAGIQNGSPDGLALVDSTGTVVEFLSYEGTFTPVDGAASGMLSIDMGVSEPDSTPIGLSLQLLAGIWTGPAAESSGDVNSEPPATIARIHQVQGNGAASPLVGQTVAVEGIVVGDFQDGASGTNGDLNGFHVQEEDADADADALTSEGIFVYDGSSPAVDVAIGDLVQVEGSVSEYEGMTEITSYSGVTVISSGNTLPAPAVLTLPVKTVDDFEAYEGMYVTFPQALVISEYFNFDRFNEIVLTSERHLTPTAEFEPGPDAIAAANAFLLDKITLDDGRTSQNPDPAIHPNGLDFDLTNLFRGGDTVANVTGVMDYSFSLYRIQPTQGADYTAVNLRPGAPDGVGGDVSVATFNVLNYFTTIDASGAQCYPSMTRSDCRGADSDEEFDRQRTKIIEAIITMDADVVGLMEIENNVADAAVANLVQGLNDVAGAGTYAQIMSGQVGTDAIKVAIVYKPAKVTPYGAHAELDSAEFLDPANTGLDRNRAALAQSFIDDANGGIFTVVVNHLKSKSGSELDDTGGICVDADPTNDIPDCDQGDGQAYFNHTRTLAASVLADWIQTDPTGSGDADILLIGDLNSYDKEDPIDVLGALGYTDLVGLYGGENAYSYVFDGQLGYLDYITANGALTSQVTGATVWHINADEPDLIDYDTSFKKDAQDAIYAPDAYRSSDHDPVIIGLNVCDEIAPTIDAISASPDVLWPANHKYVEVTTTVVASDNFDIDPMIELVEVLSSEPDNGVGDGNTVNDIVKVDDFTFKLRAERSGQGEGRTYTITYKVTDACGNEAVDSVTVFVPLNRRGGR